MREPEPPDPHWPPYAARPFPLYRYIPGRTPHPRRDPRGHSYCLPEPRPAPFPPEAWACSEDYLYAVDLYNFAYWWESHEMLEGLWHAAGRRTEAGRFFRALIHLAAANLKRFSQKEEAARILLLSGLVQLERLPPQFMGVDIAGLRAGIRSVSADPTAQPILVRLVMP